MKQIVIKANDKKYEIIGKKIVNEKTAEGVLREATKYYSSDRLTFTDDEQFKVLATKLKGEEYRIILTRNEAGLQKNIEEIFNVIHDNTALHVNLKLDEEDLESDQIMELPRDNDSDVYNKIIKEKREYWPIYSFVLSALFNILLEIALCTIGFFTPTGVIFKYAIGAFLLVRAKIKNELGMQYSRTTRAMAFCIGLPFFIPFFANSIASKISNFIGDIKNFGLSGTLNNIKNKIKKKINKIRTPKNYRGIENEIEELAKSLEEEKINPIPYNYEPNIDTMEFKPEKVDVCNLIRSINSYINLLPSELIYEYKVRFSQILSRYNIESVFTNERGEVMLVSELDTFKDEIITKIHISNSNEEVNTELESLIKKYEIRTR